MEDRPHWLGVSDPADADRPRKTMDDFRREYFRHHFPELGEWFMDGKEDDGAELDAGKGG